MKYVPAIFIAAVVVAGGVSAAHAGMVTTNYTKVKTLNTYAGDTTVFLEQNPAQCPQGFWMRPNLDGFEEKLDALEKAAHANQRVKITGNDTMLWPQLSAKDANCMLESVEMEPVANIGQHADLDGVPPDDIRHLDKSAEDGLIPKEGANAVRVPQPPQ